VATSSKQKFTKTLNEKLKSKTKNSDNDNLNFEDELGLDEDLNIDNFLDEGDEREPTTSEVSKELAKEAGVAFTKKLAQNIALKNLPSDFTYNYYEAKDYVDVITKNIVVAKDKLNKSLVSLAKEVKNVLPKQIKALDEYIERNSEEKIKQLTQEEQQNIAISSSIENIFNKQLEVQKSFQARVEAQREVESKTNITIQQQNLNVLSSIEENTSRQTAFTLQVAQEYYKKSLELQFRSYFVQANTLDTIRQYYKGFSAQLDAIVKNTALPEITKIRQSEQLKQTFYQETSKEIYERFFNKQEYVKKLKENFTNYIQSKVDSLVNVVDNITYTVSSAALAKAGAAGFGAAAGPSLASSIAAQMAGSYIADKVTDKVDEKIPSFFKEKIKNNKYLVTALNKLGMIASSPSTILEETKEKLQTSLENTDTDSITGRVKSFFLNQLSDALNVITPQSPEAQIKQTPKILSLNQPAIFDNKVYASITEVIPLYLAKILKENTELKELFRIKYFKNKAPQLSAKELTYDYTTSSLTTQEEALANAEKELFNEYNKIDINSKRKAFEINQKLLSISSLDSKTKKTLKSSEFRESLSQILKKAVEENENVKLQDIIEGKSKAVQDIASRDPKIKEALLTLKKIEIDEKTTKSVDEQIEDISKIYPINTVKDILVKLASIVGEELTNTSDKIVQVIARVFSDYIIKERKDVTLQSIAKLQAFKYLTKEDFSNSDIRQTVYELSSIASNIVSSKDIAKVSTAEFLVASLNASLKDNVTLSPKVFETINKIIPKLQQIGELNTTNLVQGKLGIYKIDYVDMEELTSKYNKTNEFFTDSTAQESFFSSFNTYMKQNFAATTKEMKNISASSSFKQNLSAVSSTVKALFTDIKEVIAGYYSEASKSFDIVEKELNEATNTSVTKLQELFSKACDNVNAKLSSAKSSILKDIEAKEALILELKSKNTLQDSEVISKSIELTQKELEQLRKELEIIIKLQALVTELKLNVSSNTSSSIDTFKEYLRANLSAINTKLEQLLKEAKS
jgi:hypothetical protein